MGMLVRVLTLWPSLAGLGVTVAIIPLTMLLGRLLTDARKASVAAADARVKLVSEVVTGARRGASELRAAAQRLAAHTCAC